MAYAETGASRAQKAPMRSRPAKPTAQATPPKPAPGMAPRLKLKVERRRPDRCPDMLRVLDLIEGMTPAEVAKESKGWVGASTIVNWRRGKTRCPLQYTLQAAARAAGHEFRLVKVTDPKR